MQEVGRVLRDGRWGRRGHSVRVTASVRAPGSGGVASSGPGLGRKGSWERSPLVGASGFYSERVKSDEPSSSARLPSAPVVRAFAGRRCFGL